MAGSRKDRFAPRFHEIGNSGIGIDPGNLAQREGCQVSENGSGAHCEGETISDEGKWRGEEESIIKPKRRTRPSSLGGNRLMAEKTP